MSHVVPSGTSLRIMFSAAGWNAVFPVVGGLYTHHRGVLAASARSVGVNGVAAHPGRRIQQIGHRTRWRRSLGRLETSEARAQGEAWRWRRFSFWLSLTAKTNPLGLGSCPAIRLHRQPEIMKAGLGLALVSRRRSFTSRQAATILDRWGLRSIGTRPMPAMYRPKSSDEPVQDSSDTRTALHQGR